MPDSSKIIDGKKFMWDEVVYETEKDAQETKKKYEDDRFEVQLIKEEDKPFLYTRRMVTEIVVEGEPPA
jgi:hypothetical protein